MNRRRKRFVRPERLKVRATSFKTIRKLEYWKARVIQCNEKPRSSQSIQDFHPKNMRYKCRGTDTKQSQHVKEKNSHTAGNHTRRRHKLTSDFYLHFHGNAIHHWALSVWAHTGLRAHTRTTLLTRRENLHTRHR